MQVSDIMSAEVRFIAADASVQEAATLMGELDVGALPVGSAEDLQGVITDRDILYRVVAEGRDPALRVREVMSRTVFTCRPDETVAAAMDLMGAYHVRRLPVLDDSRKVVGWLTLTDISRRLLADEGPVADALQALSAPT